MRFLLLLFFSALFVRAAQTPEWIWHDNKGRTPADGEVSYFRKTFRLKAAPGRSQLLVACDNQATVYINGRELVKNPSWNRATRTNPRRDLREGENVIAVRGQNESGVAALVLKLEVTYPDGSQEVIVTDQTWLASLQENRDWNKPGFDASNWTRPISLGQLGVQPWGDVMAPPVATAASSLKVLPGFKVDLLHSSDNEGSWVAMAIDPKGRLIISPQEGRNNMLRVTLDNSGKVQKMEKIDLPVGSAMGLLYAFDSLYVSGGGPDGLALYRLKDTNNDDQFDKLELLKKFDGAGGEHGSHALVLGPDQKIYYMHGNFVKVPGDISPTSPHRNYAEDTLLPRGEDGNGFGIGIKPPGGFLVRGDAEGKNWEMVAAGMRNAYDFDFNPAGEMFTYDSDMEWDWGMPWYRPTRIYHLVSGGDYGFREGTAKYPSYYPDALPPTLDVGIGSPTGVKFGTGAKFPAKYQRALYAMDWTYGRIFAVHLQPDGATYQAELESIVQGKPLNVTDMEIGRDGALYFATGGRGTQSGLYRLSYVGDESTSPAPLEPADSKHAQARALRKKLESFHGRKDPTAVDFAWPHLRSDDRWIRYAARIAIESQEVNTWQQRALDERDPNGSITALLALARSAKTNLQQEILDALGELNPEDLSEDQLLSVVRALSVSFIRMGPPDAAVRDQLLEAMPDHFPAKSDRLNKEIAQLAIYLSAPGVVENTLALAENASTLEDQIHYIFHLRTLKTGWTQDQRERYFSWLNAPHDSAGHPSDLLRWFNEAGTEYRHGASYPKFLANFKRDAVATLSSAEKEQLAAAISGEKKSPLVAQEPARDFVKEWATEDLLGSLDQVAKARSFQSGKAAFVAAQCLACHRFGNEGGSVGPDITTVSTRFSRRDLLESIIDPSKVVSEQYMNTTFDLKDGEEVTGRVVEENDTRYVVVTNPLLNTRAEVKKSDIAKSSASKFSPMPAGLVNVLKKEEILDLLAYIESAGKKDAAFFR